MALQFDQVYAQAAARERVQAMHALLRRGMSLAEVADIYQVSRERVRQLVAAHFPEYKAVRGRRKKPA